MAHPILNLKQQRIEAKAALLALLKTHEAAATAATPSRGFTDAEKAEQVAAEALVTGLDERVAAAERIQALESGKVELVTSGATVEDPAFVKDPRKGFRSSREFLLATINGSGHRDPSQVKDERLRFLAQKSGHLEAGKDDRPEELAYMLPIGFTPPGLKAVAGSDEQGEYSDTYGGFSLVTSRVPGLLKVGFEGDPTAGMPTAIPMATPSIEILARTDKDHSTGSVSGGLTVTRRPETVAAAATRAALEMVTLKATSLFGVAFGSEEILADSPISFAALIDSGFRDQFGFHMLNEKLRGKGGNEYLGILTALASLGAGQGATLSVAKETNQPADTIQAINVIKMAARCWGFDNAVWICNHETRPQLMTMSIVAGTMGVLIYTPSPNQGFPDRLLGRPIFYSEVPSAIGDQGDIILWNPTQYLEGLYQPLQSAESIHVRFLNHERTFKFWLRNCGAPWWKSPLTPFKGSASATLSPAVVLDAR